MKDTENRKQQQAVSREKQLQTLGLGNAVGN
jgi:hypothetical protein